MDSGKRRAMVEALVLNELKGLKLEDTRTNRRKALEIIRDRWTEIGGEDTPALVYVKEELERLREEMLQEQAKFGNPEDEE